MTCNNVYDAAIENVKPCLLRSCCRRPTQNERRVRCRGGDSPPSHHRPTQGAVLRPGGWEQPRVPEGEKHGAGPAAGLQYDGAEKEGLHDPSEPRQSSYTPCQSDQSGNIKIYCNAQAGNFKTIFFVLNWQAFCEELETMIQDQLKKGKTPTSLLALQQIADFMTTSMPSMYPAAPQGGMAALNMSKQEWVIVEDFLTSALLCLHSQWVMRSMP